MRLSTPNGGAFRLFARANLHEQAPVGGRAVQTTRSDDQDLRRWSAWEPVRFRGLHVDTADIYFFLVAANPVDERSLLALFPLSQPPHACIAMAFSSAKDGVTWSRPINLLNAKLGWRTTDERGLGFLEFRSTAHPAAGVFLRNEHVHFYIHEAVLGTFMEAPETPTRLTRFTMTKQELEQLTAASLDLGSL